MYKQQKKIINSNSHGFTLLELMITVVLAGFLATIGIPSFKDSLRSNRLTTSANEFISALNLARSEAIKRNQSVDLKKSGTNWENGWDVYVDLNSNGTLDAGEEIRTFPALPAQYTLNGSSNFSNFIRYLATGEAIGTNPADTSNAMFVVCDTKDGNDTPEADTSKVIVVMLTGRPGMSTAAASGITSCTNP